MYNMDPLVVELQMYVSVAIVTRFPYQQDNVRINMIQQVVIIIIIIIITIIVVIIIILYYFKVLVCVLDG